MPHFRFRSVDKSVVQPLSATLIDDLIDVMKSPREDFTFELIQTEFYHENKPSNGYPFIEVLWFDRGQTVQDQVAQIITQRVKALHGEVNVAVIFTALAPTMYYDNGSHY